MTKWVWFGIVGAGVIAYEALVSDSVLYLAIAVHLLLLARVHAQEGVRR